MSWQGKVFGCKTLRELDQGEVDSSREIRKQGLVDYSTECGQVEVCVQLQRV